MTHDELVNRAMTWLINTKGCSVAVSELSSGFEIPDAIGWRGGFSTLVEAKISLSDFRADGDKSFRRMPDTGLGYIRYFMVPMELKDKVKDLLPEKWGLLAAGKKSIFTVKEHIGYFAERNLSREMDILLSIIRRMAKTTHPLRGCGVKWYQPLYGEEHDPKATLFAEPMSE